MAHIVTEPCIKCKYTDCVTVCPVDCFHEDAEMLTINPEVCIDCGACIPECPVQAIYADSDIPEMQKLYSIERYEVQRIARHNSKKDPFGPAKIKGL